MAVVGQNVTTKCEACEISIAMNVTGKPAAASSARPASERSANGACAAGVGSLSGVAIAPRGNAARNLATAVSISIVNQPRDCTGQRPNEQSNQAIPGADNLTKAVPERERLSARRRFTT